MSWEKFLDAYEWKARWIPAAIVLLPLFVTLYYCFPDLAKHPVLLAGSGLVSVALVYLAAMTLRDLGLRRQARLWQGWGGAPSTRFVRLSNNHFLQPEKQRIRSALRRRFGIELVPEEREARDLAAADHAIEAAFRRVREFLRHHDRVGLVDKHNAEYGFARQLYAGREIALVLAVAGAGLSGFAHGSGWSFNSGVQLNLLIAALWVLFAWTVLPGMLRRTAETYAERAWMTFVEIEESL